MLRFFSLAILIQKRLAMLQSFFLAILTALTIAVVGSIAWRPASSVMIWRLTAASP
jgi:hypothetical protein